MDKKQDCVIKIKDVYDCIHDGFNQKINRDRESSHGPKGFVEIYEISDDGKRVLIGKHNLVVYKGREWLLSRAFNFSNPNIPQTCNEFISWLGLGDGGCPIGDPLYPTAPTMEDVELSNPIMINPDDSVYADYRDNPTPGYYKAPFDTLTFEQDGYNYNTWLIIRVDSTISPADANDCNISEAGLYTAESSSGGFAGPFNLYARVTFPTIVKSPMRQLLFEWYVYF